MNITPIIVIIEKLMKNYQDDGKGGGVPGRSSTHQQVKTAEKKNIPYQKHEASVRDVLRKFSLGLMTLEGRPHGPFPSAGPRLSHPCPERAIAVVLAARAGVFRAWHPA